MFQEERHIYSSGEEECITLFGCPNLLFIPYVTVIYNCIQVADTLI